MVSTYTALFHISHFTVKTNHPPTLSVTDVYTDTGEVFCPRTQGKYVNVRAGISTANLLVIRRPALKTKPLLP